MDSFGGEKKKKIKLSHPEEPEKKKIHRSKSACNACHKARARCDSQRPCSRCQRLGIADRCETFIGKKRGRKPVNERVPSPSSPTKDRSNQSPEERDDDSDDYDDHDHHDHDHDHDHSDDSEHDSLSNVVPSLSATSSLSNSLTPPSSSSSLSNSLPTLLSPSLSSTSLFPGAIGQRVPSFSLYNPTSTSSDDLQKFLLATEPTQQQYQLIEQAFSPEDHQETELEDQQLGCTHFGSRSAQNDDAMVPSLTPPQVKGANNLLGLDNNPAFYLGVDESRATHVFIRSVTRSLADLLHMLQSELEGRDFRDVIPKTMFRSVLLVCYQKLLESHDKGAPLIFSIPTLLKGRMGLVPVELMFNLTSDIRDVEVTRVEVRELSLPEALSFQLPIYGPGSSNSNNNNTYPDLEDAGVMNPLVFDDYLSSFGGGLDQTC